MIPLTNFSGHNWDEAVVDEHPLAGFNDLGDVLVVNPEHVLGALLFVGVVSGQLDLGTLL